MMLCVPLAMATWLVGHRRRFRATWSPTGHRLALATAVGLLGLLAGLAWAQHRVPLDPTYDHLMAGWPVELRIGRRLVIPPHGPTVIAEMGPAQGNFAGPHIEDAFGCLANFLIGTGIALLVAAVLPQRWCERATAVTGWLPVALAAIVTVVYSPFDLQ
ncbi:MAG: hypothetical protein JNL08_16620 [Planctomycetes bacterium]|nr:hypothetical protein [Planctomycetota bacterium]